MRRVLLLFLLALTSCGEPPARPPNIVLIFADDLGWPTLGVYGNDLVPTPHLDALARDGVRFTDAYATPQCTPSRATLLTGQNTARNRMWHVLPGNVYPYARMTEPPYRDQLSRQTFLFPKALQAAGYATAILGKWHLTTNEDGGYNQLLPEAAPFYGFDWSPPGWDPDTLMPYDRGVDWLTDRAIEFIRERRDRPFFVYLSHHTIHGRVAAPQQIVEKYRRQGYPDEGLNNATYLAAIEHLDAGVGRLLAALDDLELTENTMVVFTSDNGGVRRRYGRRDPVRNEAGVPVRLEPDLREFSNEPLRDGKGTAYEGGIRVPLIIRWPGVVEAGRVNATPVHLVDLAPTFLEAAGTAAPAGHPLDGLSLVSLLRGRSELPERSLYWYLPLYDLNWGATPAAAIRRGDWKLIEHFGDRFDREGVYHEGGAVELFNLRHDPGEARDLSTAEPDRAEAMRQELGSWMEELEVAIPAPNPSYDPLRRFESVSRASASH